MMCCAASSAAVFFVRSVERHLACYTAEAVSGSWVSLGL